MKIEKIDNVMKPELVAAFEKRWIEMKEHRGIKIAVPKVFEYQSCLCFSFLDRLPWHCREKYSIDSGKWIASARQRSWYFLLSELRLFILF
jgi:hypothetical protein